MLPCPETSYSAKPKSRGWELTGTVIQPDRNARWLTGRNHSYGNQ